MKIGIVGAGISGLASAYYLDDRHEVTLFERADEPGGHARTSEVLDADGETVPVDRGFLVYNPENYPLFCQLLEDLGVDTEASSMSFSYRDGPSGLEYSGHGPWSLMNGGRNLFRPEMYPLLYDLVRFYRRVYDDAADAGQDVPLRDYVEAQSYGPSFLEHHLLPMVAAIWSTTLERAREFSTAFVANFFKRHGLLKFRGRPQWRTVTGGSRHYVQKLRRTLSGSIRTGCAVRGIRRSGSTVQLRAGGETAAFDAVVLACHSDQALDLLENPRPEEREVLSAIPYRKNSLVMHRDVSLLPRNPSRWSAWNFLRTEGHDNPGCITYNVNVLQNLDLSPPVLVTVNGRDRIDPDRTLERYEFSHPQFPVDAVRAQRRFEAINGLGGVFYAGSYWFNGFHEDGVRSARRTVDHLTEASPREPRPL